MNCFQNVSLTYRAQLNQKAIEYAKRCELLSECIFDIPGTTVRKVGFTFEWLWIAFRMYLWHTGHNCLSWRNAEAAVVNCFQNVSLTYRAQPSPALNLDILCCELLSECIFDIPGTTPWQVHSWSGLLWIAFRMYLWHTGHNFFSHCYTIHCVVNCFQNVSLTYRAQRFHHRRGQ